MNYKLVYDRGCYDVDEPQYSNVEGRKVYAEGQQQWRGIFRRCYSEEWLEKHPTYKGCSVDIEWYSFKSFQIWYKNQYKETGWHLDKDLLIRGNKVYSQESCLVIPQELNKFLTGWDKMSKTPYPAGVTFKNKTHDMISELKKPFIATALLEGKTRYLGAFYSPEEAHVVWQKFKLETAKTYIGKYKSFANICSGLERIVDDLELDIKNHRQTVIL